MPLKISIRVEFYKGTAAVAGAVSRGSSGREHQVTVGLSTMTVFGYFSMATSLENLEIRPVILYDDNQSVAGS